MNLTGYYYQVARNPGIFLLLQLGSLEFQLCIHTFVGEEHNRCMTYSIAVEVRVGIGKLGQAGLISRFKVHHATWLGYTSRMLIALFFTPFFPKFLIQPYYYEMNITQLFLFFFTPFCQLFNLTILLANKHHTIIFIFLLFY
jgi:hypothetical protein